ncbi:MAG: Hsp20/alpha crystallin family protein [Phycisphaerae bacterium]
MTEMQTQKNNDDVLSVNASRTKDDYDTENTVSPLVDIYETEDGTTILTAEMPGASSDSLDVQVEKGVLTITAQAQPLQPEGDYRLTYGGFGTGRYHRAFALSDEIDRDNIDAQFEKGVLTLKLPRAEQAKTRKIAIKTS